MCACAYVCGKLWNNNSVIKPNTKTGFVFEWKCQQKAHTSPKVKSHSKWIINCTDTFVVDGHKIPYLTLIRKICSEQVRWHVVNERRWVSEQKRRGIEQEIWVNEQKRQDSEQEIWVTEQKRQRSKQEIWDSEQERFRQMNLEQEWWSSEEIFRQWTWEI